MLIYGRGIVARIQLGALGRGGSKFALMAAMGWGLAAAPALAQDGADADEQALQPDDGVIIVTATRRAQDVQDIPIAVTAVSSQQLEAQAIDDVTDLGSVAPSFNFSPFFFE